MLRRTRVFDVDCALRQANAHWDKCATALSKSTFRERKQSIHELEAEWDAACENAEIYRKEEKFREARETLLRFVSVRESTLPADALEWLKTQLERRVANIDRLAGTYFSSVERRVHDLAKNKRYDQAIALYRNVIANYGIDKYVRKAKEGIAEMEAKKREKR